MRQLKGQKLSVAFAKIDELTRLQMTLSRSIKRVSSVKVLLLSRCDFTMSKKLFSVIFIKREIRTKAIQLTRIALFNYATVCVQVIRANLIINNSVCAYDTVFFRLILIHARDFTLTYQSKAIQRKKHFCLHTYLQLNSNIERGASAHPRV